MGINKWAMASLPWLFLFVITREVVPAMNSSSPRNWGSETSSGRSCESCICVLASGKVT